MGSLYDWSYIVSEEALAQELPQRWAHVRGVARRATIAALTFSDDDKDLVVSAAILHDIGYKPSIALTGFHALDGARYLRDLGASLRLCSLVAHHSCAYKEAELRGLSAQLAEWKDENTPVRDVLWWADMTTTPLGDLTNVRDRIEEIQKRYGSEDLVTFFIRQAQPELIAAVERVEGRLRSAGIDYTAK